MMRRVLLAVLLCGMAAGFVMGTVQHVRISPIIHQAETFEHASTEAGHDHGSASTDAPTHAHDASAWVPTDGLERTLFTFAASMLAGAGFAGLLAGVVLMFGGRMTRENGWVWGLAGFLAVSLAPAVGLAPELPGMPAADLIARQIWWISTIATTASALWLLAFHRQAWVIPVALALALAPHVIGAPQPADQSSDVPAALSAQFASLSLGANALMWLIIGTLLGHFMPQTDLDEKP
jgi:cobalt transporter subunit CbtA